MVSGKWGQAGSPLVFILIVLQKKKQMVREVLRHLTSKLVFLPVSLREGTVQWLWGHGRGSQAGCGQGPGRVADCAGWSPAPVGLPFSTTPPGSISQKTLGGGEHSPSVFEILALAVTNFLRMRVPRVGRPVVWLRAFKEIAPLGALINVCFMTFRGMIAR